MRLYRVIITFTFCSLALISLKGQDITQPLPPVLDRVSVDPVTGFAVLDWLPGGSADVGSYVVYSYNNNTAFAIDTLWSPYAANYTHTGSAARYRSVTYVVAAMDSSLNISPLSNSLSTVYLEAVNDTCNGRIVMTWTPYSNNSHPADGYGIYLSVDNAAPVLHGTVPVTSLSYILQGYIPDTGYCLYISALSGTVPLSSSNRQCLVTGSEGAPAWTMADAIAVADGKIIITGSYDPSSDIHTFRSERKTGASGSWILSDPVLGSDGTVIIIDSSADTTLINLFRLSAVSSCGSPVAVSAPVRNIVLSAFQEGTEVVLRWNNPFPSVPALFSVWRNTGGGPEEIARGLSDTIWTEDYRSFAYDISAGEVVYHVTAVRADAPAGMTVCRSSAAAVRAAENIYVANAFTPDGDGLNDTFAPVLSFTPLTYEFRVFNRLGVLLFRTSTHGTGWDGRQGGTPLPAGAFLWTLTLTKPSGITERRNGTVTILH
ncbi:MAG TPA: gliding motility-associated C-terminal domain-containing protein [Bacteroidales bacterium]|nr:gliding motility-associated C-terminal domain-containing protein [Bacteroidales bacterium]